MGVELKGGIKALIEAMRQGGLLLHSVSTYLKRQLKGDRGFRARGRQTVRERARVCHTVTLGKEGEKESSSPGFRCKPES